MRLQSRLETVCMHTGIEFAYEGCHEVYVQRTHLFPRKGRSPLPRKMRAVATRWGGLVVDDALAGVGDGLFHNYRCY